LLLAACTAASSPVASFLQDKKAAVFVFLAPHCPLSQSYTLTLNNLAEDFEPKELGFIACFPPTRYRTAMDEFVATYHVGFRAMLDPQAKFADYFGGKGAIGNWPGAGTASHWLIDPFQKIVYVCRGFA
jgi:thiol-disulfide isomerase/thioredoxin